MTLSQEERNSLRELVELHCQSMLSEEQSRQLADWISQNEEARQYFVNYLDLHGRLAWQFSVKGNVGCEHSIAWPSSAGGLLEAMRESLGCDAGEGSEKSANEMRSAERLKGDHPSGRRRSQRVLAWAVAASLLLGTGVMLLQLLSGGGRAGDQQLAGVAQLKQLIDGKWKGDFWPIEPGTALEAGNRLELVQGTAKLLFNSGAVVVVEAPAVFVPESANVLRLHRGTVAVRANEPKNDFRVISPDAAIVDLGTSFGVHTEPGVPTEVEVFEGAVEIRDDAHAGEGRVLGLGAFAHVRRAEGQPEVELAASRTDRFQNLLAALWDDIAPELEPSVGKAIIANFDDAPIPGTVDTFYGSTRGRGWRTPWMAAGNPVGEVRHEAIFAPAEGPYLRMTFQRAIHRIVAREYGARSGFDPLQPHVLTWKWRFDGDPDHFGRQFSDRVLFFGSPKFSSNTSYMNSWMIRLAAADEVGGRFRAAYPMHWCFFNGQEGASGREFNRETLVDSGLELKPGVIYQFAVAVYPEDARYDVAIRDDEQTVVKTALRFRSRTPGPANVVHFGTYSKDETADLSFSLDSIRVEPLESGVLQKHL